MENIIDYLVGALTTETQALASKGESVVLLDFMRDPDLLDPAAPANQPQLRPELLSAQAPGHANLIGCNLEAQKLFAAIEHACQSSAVS